MGPDKQIFQATGWMRVGTNDAYCLRATLLRFASTPIAWPSCPVECFYQDDTMLYIDPADCIDCEACVPECPVEAIFRRSQ